MTELKLLWVSGFGGVEWSGVECSGLDWTGPIIASYSTYTYVSTTNLVDETSQLLVSQAPASRGCSLLDSQQALPDFMRCMHQLVLRSVHNLYVSSHTAEIESIAYTIKTDGSIT